VIEGLGQVADLVPGGNVHHHGQFALPDAFSGGRQLIDGPQENPGEHEGEQDPKPMTPTASRKTSRFRLFISSLIRFRESSMRRVPERTRLWTEWAG